MTEPIKITMRSDPSYIGVVRRAVEAFGSRHGFGREEADQIGLAVNEALANVIKHGYHGDPAQSICITLDMLDADGGNERALKVVIRDYGCQVDPETIRSRDLNQVRPGGLGVHIIKTVMDEVKYRCVPEGGMELTMLKFLPAVKEVSR